MIVKKLLLTLSSVFLISCTSAYAETTVGVHVGSWHSEPGFNNKNPGVFVIHNGFTLGTYYNSNKYQSYYAGYTFKKQLNSIFSVQVTAGAIKYDKFYPMILPTLGINNSLISGTTYIGYIPKISYTKSHIIHVMHGWSF